MKISGVRKIEKGVVIASFNIDFESIGIKVHECVLLKSKKEEGGYWVSFPQRKFELNGEMKYAPLVSMEKEVKDNFDNEVVMILKDELKLL